jgi:predicted nucleic acid-binding protein
MKLLETSYLVDYEKGREAARRYYEANRNDPLAASTVSMFELAFGVVWDSQRELRELQESLLWVDFLEFAVADAIEAARIQSELQSSGDRVPIGDVMIAGVARNRGATLVAGDDHFERIDGLDVENHRTWDADDE